MTAVRDEREPATGGPGPVRAAILVDHPAQHFVRGFQSLHHDPAVRPLVYYWRSDTTADVDPGFDRRVRWNTDLHSGYDWWSPPQAAYPARLLEVGRRLRAQRPDVLLCFGWGTPIVRVGIGYATATGTPLLYYGDAIWRHSASDRRLRLRRILLRLLFRAAAGAISIGAFNREFYIANGMDPSRIQPGVCPSDVDRFAAAADRIRPERRDDRPLVIGFAGKFVGLKAVDDLIEAVARLPRGKPWELWLIGDGPLRAQLGSLVAHRGIAGGVRFLGFKNTDELPALMSAVDVMVLPSHKDNRGLVAVEAMAAGAAMVVSSATGVWGPGDLVEHEQTGLVFPAGDVSALGACLQRLLADPALRTRLAAAGQARAMSFGPKDFARSTAAALVSAARRQRHGVPC
jgi:glycosyltransferase involved in cell wall biosynthesis